MRRRAPRTCEEGDLELRARTAAASCAVAATAKPGDAFDISPAGQTGFVLTRLDQSASTIHFQRKNGYVIAVTDADCILAPDWLERLLPPFDAGADVVAGFYRPLAGSFLQECLAATNMPDRC